MQDRTWEAGLHQMIEAKRKTLEITSRKVTLARITYQRFFRRYHHLTGGMTGTAMEVAGELAGVYRLGVARVALSTGRPCGAAWAGICSWKPRANGPPSSPAPVPPPRADSRC